MRRNVLSLIRPRLIPMITAALLVGCAAGLAYVGYISLTARTAAVDGQPAPRGLPIFAIAAGLVLAGGLIGKLALSSQGDSDHLDW